MFPPELFGGIPPPDEEQALPAPPRESSREECLTMFAALRAYVKTDMARRGTATCQIHFEAACALLSRLGVSGDEINAAIEYRDPFQGPQTPSMYRLDGACILLRKQIKLLEIQPLRLTDIGAELALFSHPDDKVSLGQIDRKTIHQLKGLVKALAEKMELPAEFGVCNKVAKSVLKYCEANNAKGMWLTLDGSSRFHDFCGENHQVPVIFDGDHLYAIDAFNFFNKGDAQCLTSVIAVKADGSCFKRLMDLTGSDVTNSQIQQFSGNCACRLTDIGMSELVHRPVRVGRFARANANQPAPGSLDLLRDRHEVAVAAHDHHRADVRKAPQVFHRIQAQPDIGTVLGGASGREQLHQLDAVVHERLAVAAKELPVAIRAIDCQRAERNSQIGDRLNIHQRLLRLEPVVGTGIGSWVFFFAQGGVQVLEVPVKGHGAGVAIWVGHGFSVRPIVSHRSNATVHLPCPRPPRPSTFAYSRGTSSAQGSTFLARAAPPQRETR